MSSKQAKLLKESKRLCWEARLLHRNSKVRYDANIDLKLLCDSVTDPKDHRIRELGSLFKETVSDSDVVVQDKALDALIAYLKAADARVAGRYAKEVCDAVMEKCLVGRPKMVEKAQMVFMLWVELEAVDAFLDAMEKAIKSQDAKAVVLAIDFMIQALSEFGFRIVPLNRIFQMLVEIFDHQDQNVRASSKGLTLEICRWVGIDPIIYGLYEKMSDTMKKELDIELPMVKLVVHPPRRIRSEQHLCGFLNIFPSEESAAKIPLGKDEYKLADPEITLKENESRLESEMTQLKNAAWKEPLEEINQLQKMSLSDPQEQNKEDSDGECGYYQFQKSSPAWWHADDYFERLSPEDLVAELTPCREWRAAHTCTRCGILDHRCRCKRRMEIVEPMYAPPLRLW